MSYGLERTNTDGSFRGKLAAVAEDAKNRFANLAWRTNAKLCHAVGKLRGYGTAESEKFTRVPMYLGKVSQQTLSNLQSLVLNAPIAEFESDDHARGYLFNPDGQAVKRIFQAGYRFRRLDAPQQQAIARALAELAPEITRQLGGGWRVINLKSWSTRVDTAKAGPNAWHLDGFPAGTYKLMIYLTPIGAATGTTEVKFDDGSTSILEGDAGTYLFFDPSALLHRGVAPTASKSERTHIELTLMRAPSIDQRLAFGGLNSAYPSLPWTRRPLLPV